MFHVLVPVDESEDRAQLALESILSLPGNSSDVRATVLFVDEDLNLSSVDEERVTSREWREEGEAPETIDFVTSRLEDAGIEVAVRHELDDPAETIVSVADELGVDRIVMSGRKKSPVGKALFGSTAQEVLQKSSVPVTVAME